MFDSAIDHFVHNVLPSAHDYALAEDALSCACTTDAEPSTWERDSRAAKRQAAHLAIAIDGMTDRCFRELRQTKPAIREAVSKFCVWPGTEFDRAGCLERVRGVANAYKHANLHDDTLPITSDKDVLAVGTAYGIDAYGVGKRGEAEVTVRDKTGKQWKFLGDVPVAMNGWMRFLKGQGAAFPDASYEAFGFILQP